MNNIRNFCIIAHIDHGKSTLADRLLELTGTMEKRQMKEQVLDTMDLEQERGITIKLQPVTMTYRPSQINADVTRISADKEKSKVEGGLLYKELTYKVRGLFFDVYNNLGPGHKESVYGNALEEEFLKANLSFDKEKIIDILYGDKKVGTYRPDFVVNEKIIIELKALPFIGKAEKKQTWHYLKGSQYRLALLVNFGKTELQVERIIYDEARDKKIIRKNQRSNLQKYAYQLNLIDTPGHVDFSYEVSRSLAAVEGAILLVDATQGVQAQTLANLYQAIDQGLTIISVVNKIDLPNANVEKTKKEIVNILDYKEEDVICASGKTGEGAEEILQAIVERIPCPQSPLANAGISKLQITSSKQKPNSKSEIQNSEKMPLRALIFDSKYDSYKGVLAYVRIVDGQVQAEDDIYLMAGQKDAHVIEVGKFSPELIKKDKLKAGDIGYIATGLKSVEQCKVGDTVTMINDQYSISNEKIKDNKIKPLPGYKEVRPMVYASFYPTEGEDYNQFRDALNKLKLNDAALAFEGESSVALGRGFRIGFLGLLHLEIIRERLSREFGFEPVITTPSVVYEIEKSDKSTEKIFSAVEMPDANHIKKIKEPFVKLDIITPSEYMGKVMELIQDTTRAKYIATEYIDDDRVMLSYDAPLSEVIINLHDGIKSASSGFASFSYESTKYRASDLVRMDVYVAEEKVEAFSQIVPKENVTKEGARVVRKLKDVIPRQNFLVKLQAAVGGKFVARENISAYRKDVTAKLYGGDVTRKRKLLKKQKKGKKRMKGAGKVDIPQKAFLEVLKR